MSSYKLGILSSANNVVKKFDAKGRSFMKSKNKSSQKEDPRETKHVISFRSEELSKTQAN